METPPPPNPRTKFVINTTKNPSTDHLQGRCGMCKSGKALTTTKVTLTCQIDGTKPNIPPKTNTLNKQVLARWFTRLSTTSITRLPTCRFSKHLRDQNLEALLTFAYGIQTKRALVHWKLKSGSLVDWEQESLRILLLKTLMIPS